MSITMWAILAASLGGLTLTAAVLRLRPAEPDLGNVLDRVQPSQQMLHGARSEAVELGRSEKAGNWLQSTGMGRWIKIPHKDLAITDTTVQRYLGEKVLCAAMGMGFTLIIYVTVLIVYPAPLLLALAIGTAVAARMWSNPDRAIRKEAIAARGKYSRVLATFIELVALDRRTGSGPTAALEAAAAIGDGMVFERIRTELDRARWSGVPPWESLQRLADEMDLPELGELGRTMQTTQSGASVYDSLRGRSKALRVKVRNKDRANNNSLTEKLTLPSGVLVGVLIAIVIGSAVFRMFGNAPAATPASPVVVMQTTASHDGNSPAG